MTIDINDKWIRLARLTEDNEIVFTSEYLSIMSELGWEAKAFAGRLVCLWADPFEHLLDHTSGDASFTRDQGKGFDLNDIEETQDVVEYWAEIWSKNQSNEMHEKGIGMGLGIEWYRDILRSKLVSISLPRSLIIQYKKAFLNSP